MQQCEFLEHRFLLPLIAISGCLRQKHSWKVYKRIEEVTQKRREGTMRVIAPGDKRRQVASGVVYKRREYERSPTEKGQ